MGSGTPILEDPSSAASALPYIAPMRVLALLSASAVLAATVGGLLEGLFTHLGAGIGLWLCVSPGFLIGGGLLLAALTIAQRQRLADVGRFWASLAVCGWGLAGLVIWLRLGTVWAMRSVQDLGLVAPILSGWIVLGALGLLGLSLLLFARLRRSRAAPAIATVGVLALGATLWGPFRALTKDMPLAPLLALLAGVGVTVLIFKLLSRRRLPVWLIAAAVALPLFVGVWGVLQYARYAHVRQPVESRQTLSRWVGLQLGGLADADADGHSPIFGGGDCDDANPAIHPWAFDVPGNGVDEDCDGADLVLLPAPQPALERHHPLPPALDRRWNLLFVSVDTVRADHLSVYGYDRPTSPNLDALARAGLVFERAYTPANSTRLALPAMLSGRAVGDLEADLWGRNLVLRPGNQPLFERLRAAGWRTEATMPLQVRDGMWFGLGPGFDAYDGNPEATIHDVSVPALVKDVRARLDRLSQAAEPWAIWVHFVEPHEPYLAHAAHAFGSAPIDKYDAEIASVDSGLGQLVAHIKALGLADSTLIVYTADHGEEFDEHGRRFHGKQVYDESARVPWIIHVPGATSVRAPAPASLIDLPATLTNLMGVPPAPSHGGVSHVPLLSGGAPDWDRGVYLECAFDGFATRAQQRGWVRWPYKAIVDQRTGLEGLYNLEDDPLETQNLRLAEPDTWQRLAGELARESQRYRGNQLRQVLARGIVDAPPPGISGEPQPIATGLAWLGHKLDTIDFTGHSAPRLRIWLKAEGPKRARARLIMTVHDAHGGRVREQNSEPFLDMYPSDAWADGQVIEVTRLLRYSARYARPLKVELRLMAEGKTILGPVDAGRIR